MSQQKEKRFIKKKINGKTKNGKYPGSKKSKAIKILGERGGARLRDNFKNPCITPSYNHFKAGDEMEIIVDENLVLKEKERLQVLYKDIPSNKLKVVDGLIIQAARLRVMLDYMWEDIKEKGDYDLFTQSEKAPPYERERPVAKLFNARDAAYQKIIKQLSDLLPEEKEDTETPSDDYL